MKKNSELLKLPNDVLGEIERQRKYLLGLALLTPPCPVCGRPLNLIDAAGVSLDEFNAGDSSKHSYKCPDCQTPLKEVVPFFSPPPWFWEADKDYLCRKLGVKKHQA